MFLRRGVEHGGHLLCLLLVLISEHLFLLLLLPLVGLRYLYSAPLGLAVDMAISVPESAMILYLTGIAVLVGEGKRGMRTSCHERGCGDH